MKFSAVFIACAALAACATTATPADQQHFTAYGEPCTAEEAASPARVDRRTAPPYKQKNARTCFTIAELRLAESIREENKRYRDRWSHTVAASPVNHSYPDSSPYPDAGAETPPPGLR